jgi:hypothetical protein
MVFLMQHHLEFTVYVFHQESEVFMNFIMFIMEGTFTVHYANVMFIISSTNIS